MLGNAYNPDKLFTYPEDEIQDYGCITEENHDQDTSLKLARIQQSIDEGLSQAPQIPTFANTDVIEATPEAILHHF